MKKPPFETRRFDSPVAYTRPERGWKLRHLQHAAEALQWWKAQFEEIRAGLSHQEPVQAHTNASLFIFLQPDDPFLTLDTEAVEHLLALYGEGNLLAVEVTSELRRLFREALDRSRLGGEPK